MFHLMPYRDLPDDFEQRYQSAYIDPVWFDVADPDKVGQYYNWTLDELVYAARSGLHGVCTNQHHQNVYGTMPSPNRSNVLARTAVNSGSRANASRAATSAPLAPPICQDGSRMAQRRRPEESTP